MNNLDNHFRGWEYARVGDYHRQLDPNWSYTPTYLKKMDFVRRKVLEKGKATRILDAGCGEGVLVEEFKQLGYCIEGIDLNYASQDVCRGSVLDMPYEDSSFDLVLFLDVLEHLAYADQPPALTEISRVLRKGGELIASIPNLAHWNSRFRMVVFGRLDRTDIETNHIGERPYAENRSLIQKANFRIIQTKGITLTVPLIYRGIICHSPARFKWLHDFLDLLAISSLAMINIFVCRKI